MKTFLILLACCAYSVCVDAQVSLSGSWQGLLIRDGVPLKNASIIYLNVTSSEKEFIGKIREELYDSDLFAVKQLKGKNNGRTVSFQQTLIEKKKSNSKTTWCLFSANLTYSDSTGYLEGNFTSTDCRNNRGKIVLYRIPNAAIDAEKSPQSHAWFSTFISDYAKGYFAPEIRKKERDNFIFQPIYFDYDKDEIKTEYHDFLIRLIRVVNGHSDLRIKVTGHTDADGTDNYNLDLSKKRAEAIIAFFTANGLSKDRLEIDFKGESAPVDNNSTPEGKQHNRRVDFSFI
jgi:outer membrane protein OmpA-like peptidoglycan-associated protein